MLVRSLILFLVLINSIAVNANCLLAPNYVDAAINFQKTLNKLSSFSVHSEYPYHGTVESFNMTFKFTTIRLKAKRKETQAFVFARDLMEERFYIYYTDGISAPYPNIIEGKISPEKCSIHFPVSETEILDVFLKEGYAMEIHSLGRDNATEEFKLKQKFVFSSEEE